MSPEPGPVRRGAFSARGRSTLVLVALAATVIAVLLQGAALRDKADPGAVTPAPAPEPSAPLRADLEKTPLSYVSDYWLQLGNRTKTRLILVGPRKTPALLVAPDLAVSTVDAAGSTLGEESDGGGSGNPSSRLLASDATVGLSLFEIEPPQAEAAFRPADPASLHPGMLVAGITLDGQGRLLVMPGHLISAPDSGGQAVDSLDVSVPVGPSTRAAAVVDLDGNLVGAILRHHEGARVVSAESLFKAVTRLHAHPTCRSIEVAELDPGVRRLLRVEAGVAVVRVIREAFPPGASIHAGDVIIGWRGQEVADVAQFRSLYDTAPAGTLVPYLLRRGPRTVRGRIAMPGPDCRPPIAPPVELPRTGLTLASSSATSDSGATPAGWRVTAVDPGGAARRSGVRPGDRILSVEGSRPDRESILHQLGLFERTGRPMVLALQRGDQVQLVALPSEAN